MVAVLLVSGALLQMGVAPGTAAAAGNTICAHGGNQVAEACFYGVLQYGDYTEFHNNNMYFTNADEQLGYHLNQTLWVYSGQPCNGWVEEGVTQGYHGAVQYEWYWAYATVAGTYQDFAAGITSPNGTNHSYQISYSGNNVTTAYRDGGFVGSMNLGPSSAGACQADAGLEVSRGELPVTHADTFDDYPLEWQDSGGAWHVGWSIADYWNDAPCGAGYSQPACFNGVFYGSNHWADNKP